MTTAPYALQTHGLFVNDALDVGIGTTGPTARVHIADSGATTLRVNNMRPSGLATAIYASSPRKGIYGGANNQTGATFGVEGYAASPNGYALYGFNEAESGNAYAVYGETNSPDGIVVYGNAYNDSPLSTGIGVYGKSLSDYDGTGVYGEATSTGTTYGVRGVSTHGIGVRGQQTTSGNQGSLGRTNEGIYGRGFGGYGDGVHGVAAGTDALNNGYGVFGESVGPMYGAGVRGMWVGDTTKGGGYGGCFTTTSSGLACVIGLNYARYGTGMGVYGVSDSPDGYGVLGECAGGTGDSSYGVYGRAASPQGLGVYGTNTSPTNWYAYAIHGERRGYGVGVKGTGGSVGVVARAEPTTNAAAYGLLARATGGVNSYNYGVHAEATGGGVGNMAGYFIGNAQVTGTLFKGGGAFMIDHPLDPKGKYLCHSFVESPDMKNIYDGVVVTDSAGYATVTLPEWFEALNRDFRYQLTVIDDSDDDRFVSAKVVRKAKGRGFTIRTSAPGIEVSWQLTGIRHDPFADANRIAVEIEKPALEYGSYLHPQLMGASIDKRVDRVREAAAQAVVATGELAPEPVQSEQRRRLEIRR